jgi:predicted unusual protein kinase regulating ubiquinone biosynthesis (AarF/ABC1/UbiB family)
VAAISEDLYELAYEQPFRFPATFTFVLRALTTLEGLGRGLDPEFNFIEVAKPLQKSS